MGIEISKRVQDFIETDGRDFIVGFPEKGQKFVSSLTGNIVTQQLGSAQECFGEIRLVLKEKPKWPASLSSFPIDGFEVTNESVFYIVENFFADILKKKFLI